MAFRSFSTLGIREGYRFRGRNPMAHTFACLRIAETISDPSPGLLPARAGSPFAGRVSHPLDDTQSFMELLPPPMPFDPQGLVALNFLSAVWQPRVLEFLRSLRD